MKVYLPVRLSLLALFMAVGAAPVSGEVREFVREHTYEAAEYDDKYSSRVAAIDELKLSLQHELGTYISSVLEVSEDAQGQLEARHDTVQITAGIVSLKLLDERWNRVSYYVKGRMLADPDEVLESVKALRNDHEMRNLLQNSLQELAQLRVEIDQIKSALASAQGAARDSAAERYREAIRGVEVETVFQQALSARVAGDFGAAFELIKGLAAQGVGTAQTRLGALYRSGVGVEQDYGAAMHWYQRAQAQGHAEAGAHIGLLYEKGLGVARDELRALSLYKQSVDAGSNLGRVRLAHLYIWGEVVPRDYAKAVELLQPAVGQGDGGALATLGFLHERGWGVDTDLRRAIDYYEQAIGKDNAWAMGRLGHLYYRGSFLEQDDRKAYALLAASAERGDGFGQAILGRMYEEGRFVAADKGKAFELFKKSAESGNLMGVFQMGHAYQQGVGVARDRRLAREWFEKAERGGHPQAAKRLRRL